MRTCRRRGSRPRTRAQGRARRQKSDVPTISLVGYTNAGKSTLFNRLVDENIYAADKLFATLDPTLRRLDWQGVGRVVLVDTVGFVRHLPHELVESFHATLEETLEADLLLHVIDSSSEDMHEQISAVKEVLADIDNEVPVLNVYNKIDLTAEPARIGYANEGEPNRVYVSSKDNLGIEELTLAVQQLMTGTLTTFNLTLPYHAGHFKNTLYELGVILEESYDDSGHECLTIRLPSERLKQLLGEANLQPMEVLPLAQATLLMPILEPFEQNNEEDLQPSEDESLVAEDLTYEQIFETDNESSDHTAIDDNPSPQA